MRVAVTGGSGQLGSLVLRRLADERSISRIVAIDLRPPLVASSKIEDVRLDIRDKSLGGALHGCDVLVHLAFLVAKRAPRSVQDSVNVQGSENVFRSALAAGIRRMLYASSVAQYGVVPTLPVPVVEDTQRTRQPDFWYAAAKHDVERRLDEMERANPDLRLVRFRPAILIGNRMEHQLGTLLRKRLLPDVINLPVVWDEDAADAFILALRTGARGAYNLAADEQLPARDLARLTGLSTVGPGTMRAVRTGEKLLTALRLLRPADPGWSQRMDKKLVYSSEKAKRELGWKPKCPKARDVLERFLQTVPRKLDRRVAVFARVVNRAQVASSKEQETLHLELSGPNGGDVTVASEGGRLRVRLSAPRPPDATARMKADTLFDLLSGKLALGTAVREGEVQLDEHPQAALLEDALRAFSSAGNAGGLRGASARLLSRWMAS
jgi:UDP-glucose 4-epimerase